MRKLKIKKNDLVKVIAGKDKDKEGKVLRVIPEKNRVVVEGINLHAKTLRKSDKFPSGGIAKVEAPIDISNVMLICPKCNKPTRVGRRDEEHHPRYCKKCKKNID
ncbi:MAG: 50S ribosomal protein L24 [Spirochaetes bacterium]|nr:50S ribosomal protein L24 [Spirochaetota bacterium]